VSGAPLLDLVLVLAAIWLAWQLRRLWLVLIGIWLGLIAIGIAVYGPLYIFDAALHGHLWAIALAIGILAALAALKSHQRRRAARREVKPVDAWTAHD
jgi:hypothetical protein